MRQVTIVALACFVCLSSSIAVVSQPIIGLDKGPTPPHLLVDQDVEDYRLELIELAWRAATSYPVNPHIKNRARAEEQVVLGALGIDQAHLAWGYAKQVVNWRRGACYAEIAHYLIEQDDPQHVAYFLQEAIAHSKDAKQGWRHARVKARVAQARVLMSSGEPTDELIEKDDVTGTGQRVGAEAAVAEDEDFDRLIGVLDSLVASQGYDAILAAMNGYAELYVRFYDNPMRRALLIAKTRAAWKNMPGLKRFETILRFADAAMDHDDSANAGALVKEADAIRQSFTWAVDVDLRLRSEVAGFHVRLGDDSTARAMLDASMVLADKGIDSLQNFHRAGALRPVAQGYAQLGDHARAHELYARVVELGAVNPNLRPRVSDITSTCVSMALHGVEPDAELLASIKEIVSELGNP